jgi:glycerophosphoryl diester phosphodiesterase
MPLLIAHRGASASHPENTAAAFTAAIAAGADGIELDVRLCTDRVVVCHDGDLRRFGGSGRALGAQPWSGLSRVDVGAWKHRRFRGEGLLDLDGLLDRFARRTTLLIELKPPRDRAGRMRLVRAVVDALARRRLQARVFILCFDLPVLALVGRRDPGLRLVWNRERPPRRLAAARSAGVQAIDCDLRRLTPAAADRLRAGGFRVFTYSANTPGELARARSCAVDAVLSDHPAWLVKAAR